MSEARRVDAQIDHHKPRGGRLPESRIDNLLIGGKNETEVPSARTARFVNGAAFADEPSKVSMFLRKDR